MDLFTSPHQFTKLISQDGSADYLSHFYSVSMANKLMESLLSEVELTQGQIYLFGKEVAEPRLKAWYGDSEAMYRYSGASHQARPWTPVLLKIKEDVEKVCKRSFNSVLVNYYRNGEDYMGPHRDDEKELGQKPIIASVSFGAERDFVFKHKDTKERVVVSLENGSLLLMQEGLQDSWYHGLPKRVRLQEGRLNLTFRNILDKNAK